MASMTYRDAGVDLEGKHATLRRLANLARTTRIPGVMEGLGNFSGLFALADSDVVAGVEDPVLVASADGVGTKVKLLAASGRHRTAGLDLVAMCVNDVVACGGQPLFFLDYLAGSGLEPQVVEAVVEGVAEGCRLAGCALLGGETAQMPGVYREGEYDLAGFCVGVAARSRLFGPHRVQPGDRLVGLWANGLHANGFSLVRRVLERSRLQLSAPAPWQGGATLEEELLRPTPIYVRPLMALAAAVEVHAAAHITGGGLPDNVGRILRPGLRAEIVRGSWPQPPVFGWLAAAGEIERHEMFRVFNMGLGMVVAVSPEDVGPALAVLRAAGQEASEVGRVVEEPQQAAGGAEARACAPSGFAPLGFGSSAKRPEPTGRVEILDA